MSTLHSEAQIVVASTSQSPFELIKKTNSTGFEKFIDKNMKTFYTINIHQKSNSSGREYGQNSRELLTIFTVRFIYILAPYCRPAVGGLNMYKFSNCL